VSYFSHLSSLLVLDMVVDAESRARAAADVDHHAKLLPSDHAAFHCSPTFSHRFTDTRKELEA
jgi:hypothetical protein